MDNLGDRFHGYLRGFATTAASDLRCAVKREKPYRFRASDLLYEAVSWKEGGFLFVILRQ